MTTTPTVGVLALQGDFAEHLAVLRRLGVSAHEVRTAPHLAHAGGLIIPGGESTTMATVMDAYGLREALLSYARSGRPVWGTCAGMVLLADRLVEDRPEPLGLMAIRVQRNGFGRQVDSFETDLEIDGVEGEPFHGIFIRAPVACEPGPSVRVLAQLPGGEIVAAQQGHLLATAFHPELTPDPRMHRYFLDLVGAAVTP